MPALLPVTLMLSALRQSSARKPLPPLPREIRIIQPEGECCPACCRCAHTNSGSAQAAVLYPLIGTCRLNNTELKKWLRYVIEHIQDWPANRVRDLLPWEVELTAQ